MKTNKNNATPGLRHDSHTLFQHSKVGYAMFLSYLQLSLPISLVMLNSLLGHSFFY